MDLVTTSTRAPRLTPAERRDAILDAVIPLILDEGPDVTSRQMAAAAGVAEGTVFRVFEDKDAVVRAAVLRMLDPRPAARLIRDADPRTLEDAAIHAVTVISERMRRIARILHTIDVPHERGDHEDPAMVLDEAVADLLAPFAGSLSCTPVDAATHLRVVAGGLVLAHRQDPDIAGHARTALGGLAARPVAGPSTLPHPRTEETA